VITLSFLPSGPITRAGSRFGVEPCLDSSSPVDPTNLVYPPLVLYGLVLSWTNSLTLLSRASFPHSTGHLPFALSGRVANSFHFCGEKLFNDCYPAPFERLLRNNSYFWTILKDEYEQGRLSCRLPSRTSFVEFFPFIDSSISPFLNRNTTFTASFCFTVFLATKLTRLIL